MFIKSLKNKKYLVVLLVVCSFIFTTHTVIGADTQVVFAPQKTEVVFAPQTTPVVFAPQRTDVVFSPQNTSAVFAPQRTDVVFGSGSSNSSQGAVHIPYSSGSLSSSYGRGYSSYGGSYGGFGGYTSSYTYAAQGSTYTPTWTPNVAGWNTDYQTNYGVNAPVPNTPAFLNTNPADYDTSGWTTDYRLTYNTNTNNYRVICSVDDTTVDRGDEVEFTARVSGGVGDYEYEWIGDDDIDSSRKSFEHEFDANGIYRVSVEVTDEEGYTTYDDCDAVYVGRDHYSVNYVQDYGYSGGDLASANSVYLSQVPYTGAEDTAKIIGFSALLIVWSVAVGYYLIKRKQKDNISSKIADFKKANRAARA